MSEGVVDGGLGASRGCGSAPYLPLYGFFMYVTVPRCPSSNNSWDWRLLRALHVPVIPDVSALYQHPVFHSRCDKRKDAPYNYLHISYGLYYTTHQQIVISCCKPLTYERISLHAIADTFSRGEVSKYEYPHRYIRTLGSVNYAQLPETGG